VTSLLAVSGGADSVALLRAVHALKCQGPGRLLVAHFNHRLRGDDSSADQQFVVALSESLRLEYRIGQAPGSQTRSEGDGLEAAARAARYAFLQATAEQLGARYVLTAHTSNDQAETILHHVLRGTGLAGLAGMKHTRLLGPAVTLVRPLLAISRRDVLEYLAALDQPYREDKTNADLQYTRNRIRHELLPLLERGYSPTVVESLLRLGAVAADAQQVIDGLTGPLSERSIMDHDANSVTLDCRELARQDRHLVRELMIEIWRRQAWPLQAMGYAEWNLLADMALAPSDADTKVFPGAIRAQRRGERLVLGSSDR
jgi:tRNA(Ile)-lysidine synthase